MDPAAHTLVGACLADSDLKKTTPLATATLILGANLPDIDAVAMAVGPDFSLWFRRGWTHGVLAMAILPLVLVGALLAYDRLWRRRRDPDAAPARLWPLVGLSYLATLTHPLLDWLNTYGVRLLMPFDQRWFYGDSIFIVDPWMWLLLAAAVVLAHSRSRLSAAAWIVVGVAASAAVMVADMVPWGAKVAWGVGVGAIVAMRQIDWFRQRAHLVGRVALVALGLYIVANVVETIATRQQVLESFGERGEAVTAMMAGPEPVNPFVRTGVVATPHHHHFFEVDWAGEREVRQRREPAARVRTEADEAEVDAVIEAARSAPSVRGYVNWVRFPHYEVERLDDGWRVTMRDVRYLHPDDPVGERGIGGAVVELDEDLEPR